VVKIAGRPQADDFAVRQAEQRVINQACSNSGAGNAPLGIMTVKYREQMNFPHVDGASGACDLSWAWSRASANCRGAFAEGPKDRCEASEDPQQSPSQIFSEDAAADSGSKIDECRSFQWRGSTFLVVRRCGPR
jgi:hypothetical protein